MFQILRCRHNAIADLTLSTFYIVLGDCNTENLIYIDITDILQYTYTVIMLQSLIC